MQRRILFLDQYGDIGGGQTVLLSLLQAALGTGANVTLIAPGNGTLQQAVAQRFGTAVTFVAQAGPALTHGRKNLADVGLLLTYGWSICRHFRMLRQQDIIYLNGPRHLPHMVVFSLFLRAQMFCHLHLDHTGAEKKLLRLAARWPNPFRLVANSRFVMNALGARGGDVILLENALDERFGSLAFQDRFGGAHAPWRLSVIGTVRPEKGQDIAVDACADRPETILHVIGRDGDGADAWIRDLKATATANIAIDGPTTDLPVTLEKLGVQFNLVPSRWKEPFGLVAIESMACSCITIVSGRGGLAEIAERTGALVAADKTAVEQTLNHLFGLPPAKLRDIARAQYEAAQHHYSPARFLEQAKDLFIAALQKSPQRLS